MARNDVHIVESIQKYFLLGALLLLVITLFYFIADFIGTLFIAAIIVSVIYPLHRLLNSKIRIPRTISAFVTLLLTTILIIVPLTLFFFAVVRQASGAYLNITKFINDFVASDLDVLPMLEKYPLIHQWMSDIIKFNPISADTIFSSIGDFIGAITSVLVEQTTNILKQATVLIFHIVVFVLALYFFIRDGENIVEQAQSLIPLREEYRKVLLKKIHDLMHAIVFGIFGAAIVQGFFVYLGFRLVGISNPAFWGALAGMFAPVPYFGPTIVWFPAVLMFFANGQWGIGIFLWIWGALVVGLSDNIVKPLVIGSGTALHPFAVLLVILGGIFAFGFKGLVFGPLVLTLTLAFLHIYKLEYASILSPAQKIPSPRFLRRKIARVRKNIRKLKKRK